MILVQPVASSSPSTAPSDETDVYSRQEQYQTDISI